MAIDIPRGKRDEVINQIINALQEYQAKHPSADISLYRQNQVSIRIRVIDPDFKGLEKSQRHAIIWAYLNPLPDEVSGDISSLILLSPDEKSTSFANFEFEDPIPSRF